ncbi:MAG: hypothetical protein M1830_007747 [Pleopsidium flavum]|nr:MAG: hypothetical protein M1830_007747 [Pleopsidium flavum]
MATTNYPTTLPTINLQLDNNIILYKGMQKVLAYDEKYKIKNTHVFDNSELIYKSKLICFLENKVIHRALQTKKSKKARKMNTATDVTVKTLKYNLIQLHVAAVVKLYYIQMS